MRRRRRGHRLRSRNRYGHGRFRFHGRTATARSPVVAAPTRGAAAGYRRGARWRRRRPHDRNSTLVRDDPALSDMCMFHICRRIHRFSSATAISATPQTAFPTRVARRHISGRAPPFGGYSGIRVHPVCSVVEIIRVVNVYAVKDIEPAAHSSRSGYGHIEPGGPDTHNGGCDIGFRWTALFFRHVSHRRRENREVIFSGTPKRHPRRVPATRWSGHRSRAPTILPINSSDVTVEREYPISRKTFR